MKQLSDTFSLSLNPAQNDTFDKLHVLKARSTNVICRLCFDRAYIIIVLARIRLLLVCSSFCRSLQTNRLSIQLRFIPFSLSLSLSLSLSNCHSCPASAPSFDSRYFAFQLLVLVALFLFLPQLTTLVHVLNQTVPLLSFFSAGIASGAHANCPISITVLVLSCLLLLLVPCRVRYTFSTVIIPLSSLCNQFRLVLFRNFERSFSIFRRAVCCGKEEEESFALFWLSVFVRPLLIFVRIFPSQLIALLTNKQRDRVGDSLTTQFPPLLCPAASPVLLNQPEFSVQVFASKKRQFLTQFTADASSVSVLQATFPFTSGG
jgi:hypothetical protein